MFCLAFVSGMPFLEIGLNDRRREGKEVVRRKDILPMYTERWIRFESPEFHETVDKVIWEEDQVDREISNNKIIFSPSARPYPTSGWLFFRSYALSSPSPQEQGEAFECEVSGANGRLQSGHKNRRNGCSASTEGQRDFGVHSDNPMRRHPNSLSNPRGLDLHLQGGKALGSWVGAFEDEKAGQSEEFEGQTDGSGSAKRDQSDRGFWGIRVLNGWKGLALFRWALERRNTNICTALLSGGYLVCLKRRVRLTSLTCSSEFILGVFYFLFAKKVSIRAVFF